MSWRDRDYARGNQPSFGENPLMWLLAGRIFFFRAFGVDVYLHASMLVLCALVLLFGTPFGATPLDRMAFVVILFGVVLLHEFGHVFGARISGGESNLIELTPLGGLAFTMPRKGAWPTFVTVACGPLVNVIICLVAGAVLFGLVRFWPLGPFSFDRTTEIDGLAPAAFNVAFYAYYVYSISYFLLLFNLLPVYPLDGGRLVQAILWFKLSWYKSTLVATSIGLVGSVLMVMYAITITSLLMGLIGVMCFLNCFQLRKQLKAAGPYAFGDEDEPDWSASLREDGPKPGVFARFRESRQQARAERDAKRHMDLDRQVDLILAKVSSQGMNALTARERKTLAEASKNKRGRWVGN